MHPKLSPAGSVAAVRTRVVYLPVVQFTAFSLTALSQLNSGHDDTSDRHRMMSVHSAMRPTSGAAGFGAHANATGAAAHAVVQRRQAACLPCSVLAAASCILLPPPPSACPCAAHWAQVPSWRPTCLCIGHAFMPLRLKLGRVSSEAHHIMTDSGCMIESLHYFHICTALPEHDHMGHSNMLQDCMCLTLEAAWV